MEFQRIKKETVPDSIINQIKEMIMNNKLKAGDKFPSERELAEKLSVSRPSVREAMRSLQSLGIVDIRSGEGTFLNDNISILSDHFKMNQLLKKYSVLELIEARKILEVEVIKLAVKRATPAMKELLEETLLESIKNKDDIDLFLKADFAFHLAIAEASRNLYFKEMINITRDLLIEFNKEVIKKEGQIDRAIESHRRIFKAFSAGDVKTAVEEMTDHLETIEIVINEIYNNN